jgi:hypothetical protein
MAVPEIRRLIEEGLSNPDISPEDARELRQMQALDARARANSAEEARIAARDQQLEAELKAVGERAGAPIGRYLAARGVTKATSILRVLPAKLSTAPAPSGDVGFFGDRTGFNLGLLIPDEDRGNAIAAFNLLRQAVNSKSSYAVFNGQSVMGDVAKLGESAVSGIGAHRLAILKAAVAELPEPAAPAPATVERAHGLSRLGFLRRYLAPSQRSR